MMNGSYRVNVLGAATLAEARELRVNGSPVTVEVHDGAATVFIGTRMIFDGPLPADVETPADVFAWAADTALNFDQKGTTMLDLNKIKFGTVLISPDRKRFAMVDAGTDSAGADFAWLVPVDAHDIRTGKRRVRLYFGEAAGWMTLATARLVPKRYALMGTLSDGGPGTVAFDAPDDETAKCRAEALATARGFTAWDVHYVRTVAAVEADCAALKRSVPLTVRVK